MSAHFAGFSPNDFDFDNCDAGGGLNEPGVYRVKLVEFEYRDDAGRVPSNNLKFQVITGTAHGQSGKFITEYMRTVGDDDEKTKKMTTRAMGWGKRMGVYTKEMAMKLVDIPFEKAIGKEFIIKVEENSYEANSGEQKTNYRIAYQGIWGLDHPDAPSYASEKGAPPAATSNGKVEPAKAATAAKTTTAGKAPAATRRDI